MKRDIGRLVRALGLLLEVLGGPPAKALDIGVRRDLAGRKATRGYAVDACSLTFPAREGRTVRAVRRAARLGRVNRAV